MLRGLREKRKMKVTPGGDGEERMMQNVPVRVTEVVCGLRSPVEVRSRALHIPRRFEGKSTCEL
jgi:hypothetical protein